MDSFNPYYTWLGIPVAEQPANHYRLLGISLFESNPDVIENAADRQSAHVAARAIGPRSEISQRILNELARAKLCLLDPQQKAAYDHSLRNGPSQANAATAPTPQLADTLLNQQSEPGSSATGIDNPWQPVGRDRAVRRRLASWSKSSRRGVYLALSIIGGGGMGVLIAMAIIRHLLPESKPVAERVMTESEKGAMSAPAVSAAGPPAIPNRFRGGQTEESANGPTAPSAAEPSPFVPVPSVRSPALPPRAPKSDASQQQPGRTSTSTPPPTQILTPKPSPLKLPAAVDLPVAEESRAQPLFSIPDTGASLSLRLDCSLAVFPEEMQVTLEAVLDAEHPEWQILASQLTGQEACSVPRSVGVLTWQDSELQIQWTAGADANVVNQMRNCVLAVGAAETLYVSLRTPVKAKPISLVMPEGTTAHTFQIDYAPRIDSLQIDLEVVPANVDSKAALELGKSTELTLDEKLQASISNRMSEEGLLSISCGLSSEDQKGFLSAAKIEEMAKRVSNGITNASRSYERARLEAAQAQSRINDRRTNASRKALDRGILATKQKAMATIEKSVARMQAELQQLEDLRNRVVSRERISQVRFRLIARSETCAVVVLEAME